MSSPRERSLVGRPNVTDHGEGTGTDKNSDEAIGKRSPAAPRSVSPVRSNFMVPVTPAIVAQVSDLLGFREEMGRWASTILASSSVFAAVQAANKNLEILGRPLLESVSRAIVGDSLLTSNLAAQWAQKHVFEMTAAPQIAALEAIASSRLQVLNDMAELVTRNNRLLASLTPITQIARPAAYATKAWEDVVRLTPPEPSTARISRLEIAGRTTGWAVHSGVVLTRPSRWSADELESETTAALGPMVASVELRVRLGDLHPDLPRRLDGAWERIVAGGADAASQAANSLMELVDWALRLTAPDAAVLDWHAAEGRPSSELHNRSPTRTLRLRYAVRDQPGKKSALELYLKTVQQLTGVIQQPKHAVELGDERALAPIALTVEGMLLFMLGP